MLIPRESDTMHVCRIRLSVAVLQGLDGSGLGGTFSIQLRCIVMCNPLSQFLGKKLQQGMVSTVHVLNRRMLPRRIGSMSRHAEMLLLQEHNVETWGLVKSLTKQIVSTCIVYTQHIHGISKYFSQYMYSIYTTYT